MRGRRGDRSDRAGHAPITETYERIGDVPCWVHDLERRWQEEEEEDRARAFVRPEESIVNVIVPTRVPPQVAWEFLTAPGQRRTWQPGVTDVVVSGATGGRRGVGATNHCMHGKDAVTEEILDWRPYDYVTDRTIIQAPTGPVKLLHTLELEPTAEGTTIHIRFGPPKTARERAAAKEIGPPYEQALRAPASKLVEGLEAALAARDADHHPEPDVRPPRPDGVLAGLAE